MKLVRSKVVSNTCPFMWCVYKAPRVLGAYAYNSDPS